MPFRPQKPCPERGCPTLIPPDARRCPEHQRAYEHARGSAASRGYDATHREWRHLILTRDPFCRDPDRRHPGWPQLATVADHIRPLRQGGDWSPTNGQGLCASCHQAKRQRESQAVKNPIESRT